MNPDPVEDQILVATWQCLGMDSLARFIKRGEDVETFCRVWRLRYGHEWPVYAIIQGKELKHE
jgi:hypothetical protein